ncbi:MAG: cytochrome C oxidase subunit II [Ardenticatenia bacterium]|nr:cytochrome C oxidase subunit II [Ardenticatenia bacterium]
MTTRTSTLLAPQGRWWGPLGKDERLWFALVVAWALAMYVMMQFVWPAVGEEQIVFDSYKVDPKVFQQLTDDYIAAHQTGTLLNIPIVDAPPGDVYLLGERFRFRPLLNLKQGQTYRFLISSVDVQHGFSVQPDNFNLQVVPGYVTAVTLTPKEAGTYQIVCNEYCGPGHHLMLGRIEVTP